MTSPGQEQARRAGRGGVAVLGAKVFFVVSGFVQQALLPRAIGLAGYGAWSLVSASVNILNNPIIASSTQGVSRVVARSLGRERDAFRSVFRVHVALALLLAVIFAMAAPAIVWFEGAPDIALPLAAISAVVLLYGLYAPIIGLLNGRGEFTRQAGLDVTFATIRTLAMLGAGWLFVRHARAGVMGATLGFIVAAACIVLLAARAAWPLHVSGEAAAPGAPTVSGYLSELWPLALAQLFTSAVMQVDILLLGHFLSSADAGNTVAAKEWTGVYRACQLFAFLPYQLLLSITQVLFPMLARAKAEGDPARVRLYVERGARLAAIACGMMVSVLVAIPRSVLGFVYTSEIAERGAHTLRILAIGQGVYTMLAIATTVLSSLGQERRSARITFAALASMLCTCALLASRATFGEGQLLATATGITIGLAVTLLAAALRVRKETGGFVPGLTVARVLAALAVAGGLGSLAPVTGHLVTPLVAVGVAVVYLAVLTASRELTRADAHALRALRSG